MSFNRMFAAAALAVSLVASAAPASAAVFAQFLPDTGSADFKWVRSGSPSTGGELFTITSTSSTVMQGVATHFSFLDPALSALAFLPATFKLDATVPTGNPAVDNGGGLFTQLNVNGSFSFTYSGATTTIGSFSLVHNVTNLLSGVFTGAWMQGAGRSGSANLAVTSGGLSYTSDVDTFPGLIPGTEEFAFTLLDVTPGFGAATGKALNSFTANGGGNFSYLTVPEPGAWSLMITGFGVLGGLLRLRRRTAIA